MKFDQLTTFVAAADDLNFSQAARRLYLSQSAVSQQIRELEEHLGVTLFERRGRGLALTPAGERLRHHVGPILRDVKYVQADLANFRGVAQGVLRIGATHTPGVYLLPHALGRFSQDFPGVNTSLGVADTEGILTQLREGELDLALLEEEPAASRIHGWGLEAFLEDELTLVVPKGHPWAARGRVTLEELADQPFIFRQRTSSTRRLILDTLSQAGLAPDRLTTRFELGNTEGIKHAIGAGLGVGFVSRWSIAVERAAGVLHEVTIDGVRIRRSLWLLRPPADKLAQPAERFADLLMGGDWLPTSLAERVLA